MKFAYYLFSISLILPSLSSADEVISSWDFDSPSDSKIFKKTREVDIHQSDGILHVETTGGDPRLILREEVESPVRLKMRMRSGGGAFGRMELFWRHTDEEEFTENKAAMYPVVHDMEWREYDFGLPITDGPSVIRIDPGWKKGTFEFDSIRLVADPLDQQYVKAIDSLPGTMTIEDASLSVSFEKEAEKLSIIDKRTDREWFLDLEECQGYIVDLAKVSEQQLRFTIIDQAQRIEYTSNMTIKPEGILHFDLDMEKKEEQFWALRTWPPRIQSSLDEGRILFCDRSSGTVIDQYDDYYGGREITLYGNTRCTDLPWVGMVDWASGDGVMTLAETPADARFSFIIDEDSELIWPQLRWRPSLDTFRYKREMSFRFSPGDRHVGLANVYREYAEEIGRLKTLRQKAEEVPHVDRLMGGAIIWGATDALQFVREARNLGVLRATICNANHGLRDPDSLRKINEMGYLTLEYDSLSDIMDGPTGFQTDDVDATAYHARPGLGPKGGWVMADGTRYSERSSAFALRALKAYVPPALKKFGFNARFVDVAMAIDLQEDWHPEHTFDRRQDMAYKREAYEYLRSLDLVIGTEHGNDWGVDLVDFFEGAAGGPFHWYRQGTWSSGGLTRPTNRDDYKEEYLEYGVCYEKSIPLWQLVYQDCTVSTWYWGDTPGFHYHVAPDISDRKDLFNILYGTPTLLWRDDTDYSWTKNQDRFLQSYHDTAHLQGAVAYAAMVSHQFISEDMAIQRTRFEDGTEVVVNFDDEPRIYTDDTGEDVHLAPKGYMARGPKIRQERVIEDGEIVKRIETEGFHLYETSLRKKIGPVSQEGLFIAFGMPGENHWRMVLEPNRRYIIDVPEMTGWDGLENLSLIQTDSLGEQKRVVTFSTEGDLLDFTTPADSQTFALYPSSQEKEVLIYPPAGEIGDHQQLVLSTSVNDADIRYTLDGSEPNDESPLYYGPFRLAQSGEVRAQAFVESERVGSESRNEYTVYHQAYHSGVVLHEERIKGVVADLSGANYLRLKITDAGNGPWADLVDLVEPYLIQSDGTRKPLWEMEPVETWFMHEEMTVGKRDEGTPLTISGRVFDEGLGFRAESTVIYELDGEFEYLEGWVGIDDSAANPMMIVGSAELIIDAFEELPE